MCRSTSAQINSGTSKRKLRIKNKQFKSVHRNRNIYGTTVFYVCRTTRSCQLQILQGEFGRERERERERSEEDKEMGGFDQQVKERTKELKHIKTAAMKGIKAAGESCKKAWSKVRSSIKR